MRQEVPMGASPMGRLVVRLRSVACRKLIRWPETEPKFCDSLHLGHLPASSFFVKVNYV